MKVAITGSRSIRKLPPEAITRINNIVSLKADIYVGDARGVDAAVQNYLYTIGYKSVSVWYKSVYRNSTPRNLSCGILPWKLQPIYGTYTDRDIVMLKAADYQLAIWDGRSPGTLRNINQMPDRTRIVKV